jgi:hypothetical protein
MANRRGVGANVFTRKGAPSLQDLTDGMLEDAPQVVERIVEVEKEIIVSVPALMMDEQGNIPAKKFTLAPTGLQIVEDATEEDYERVGRTLLNMQGALQWWIGDWIVYGDAFKWGETYKRLAVEFGYEIDTLYRYAALCRKIQFGIRNPELDPAHHRLVAYMDEELQTQWLAYAAAHELKVEELRQAIRSQHPTKPPTLSRLMKRFSKHHAKHQQEYLEIASGVGEQERHIMAYQLRKLADEIEGLSG